MARGFRTLADVLARCVIKDDTRCWIWQGATTTDGSPRLHTFDHARNEKRTLSGTVGVWNIAHQASPLAGYLVFRGCVNMLCMNPAHFRLAKSRKELGAHIRRNGARKGTAMEARRANQRLAMEAKGVQPTAPEKVRAIREADPNLTNKQVGAIHGVPHWTVSKIRLGRSHKGI